MLLAAHALGEQAAGAKLAVNGAPIDGSLVRALTAEELEQGLTIANNGDTETDAVVSVIGASLTPEPAVSKGFTISRTYYTLDGKEIDLASANGGASEIAQNERLVAVLKIESDEAAGRVLLVDRLPAGLEIENPRLVDSGDIKTLDWLRTTRRPEHTEFRDDRFVAAFDLWNSQNSTSGETEESSDEAARNDDGTPPATDNKAPAATATVAYVVRAVTPGSFVHPAATIEDMYRPERYARSGAGTLVVKPKS
jgi:uncharacterized protein YfaS (alpha-2-macroglobulin family)